MLHFWRSCTDQSRFKPGGFFLLAIPLPSYSPRPQPLILEPISHPWHHNPRPELRNPQPRTAPPLLLHPSRSRAKVQTTAFGSSSQSLWPTPSRRRQASGPMPRPAGLGEAARPPPRADHLQLARRRPPEALHQGAMRGLVRLLLDGQPLGFSPCERPLGSVSCRHLPAAT